MNHEKTTELLFDAYLELVANGNESQLVDNMQSHIEKSGLAPLLEVYQFLKNNPTHCVEHLIRQNGYDEQGEFVCKRVGEFELSFDFGLPRLVIDFEYDEHIFSEPGVMYVYSKTEIEF